VLGPLRLSELGWGAAAVGATYLVSAAIEAAWAPALGHASDRYGRFLPLRAALVASAIVAALLPWPHTAWLLAFLIVCGGLAFGSFWTPALSMVTDAAEARGLDYGYAFALVNLAWAPGQAGGSAIGGAVASASRKTVLVAVAANATIATVKGVAGVLSGSSALLAEAAHSVADTTNQLLLLVSIGLGEREPDEEHPFGYGKERFFWTLLAAVLIEPQPAQTKPAPEDGVLKVATVSQYTPICHESPAEAG